MVLLGIAIPGKGRKDTACEYMKHQFWGTKEWGAMTQTP